MCTSSAATGGPDAKPSRPLAALPTTRGRPGQVASSDDGGESLGISRLPALDRAIEAFEVGPAGPAAGEPVEHRIGAVDEEGLPGLYQMNHVRPFSGTDTTARRSVGVRSRDRTLVALWGPHPTGWW